RGLWVMAVIRRDRARIGRATDRVRELLDVGQDSRSLDLDLARRCGLLGAAARECAEREHGAQRCLVASPSPAQSSRRIRLRAPPLRLKLALILHRLFTRTIPLP